MVMHLCAKNQKNWMNQSREKLITKCSHVKRTLCVCWVHKGISLKVKNTILSRIRFFREKLFRPFFRRPYPLTLSKKSEKTNEAILQKAQKTLFLGHFGPKYAEWDFFFENRAPSHFGLYHFASLCQKSEITNEPISRKVYNRRTDERTTVNL